MYYEYLPYRMERNGKGVLSTSEIGREFYGLNPLYRQEAFRIGKELRDLFGEKIKKVYISGSVAEGKISPRDLDLVVIIENLTSEEKTKIDSLKEKYDKELREKVKERYPDAVNFGYGALDLSVKESDEIHPWQKIIFC